MVCMGVYDQIKKAFQDLIAPELHAIRGDLRLLDQKIDGVDARLSAKIDGVDARLAARIDGVDARLATKIDALDGKVDSLKAELLAEIRRVDTRIDGVDRELRTAIDVRERLAALEARRAP
jgi:hypothetical protein